MSPPTASARRPHDSHIQCPVCKGALTPRVLECGTCDIRVEGHFETSEFAALDPDDLHFLRIFIACEGRIRDMEAALGVSYPTVKSHLAKLKEHLGLESTEDVPDTTNATRWTKSATRSASRGGGKTKRGTRSGQDETSTPALKPRKTDTQAIIEKLESGELDYESALKQIQSDDA